MRSEWSRLTLGDLVELKRGYDLPKRQRIKGRTPIISSSGVSDFHSTAKIKSPGVVTGRYGTIGKVFYSDVDFWPLNTTLYVRDFKGNDPRFIYYFLKTIPYEQYSDKAAVPGVNRNHLHMANITAPTNIKEQKRIAHTLSSLDNKIQLNQQTNQTLEAMAQALFKSWFVDFDPVIDNALAAGNPIPAPFQKRAQQRTQQHAAAKPSTAALPDDIRQRFPCEFEHTEELGWVPLGWEVKPFSKVIDKYIDNRGKTPPLSETGIPLVEVKHLLTNEPFPALNTDKYVSKNTFETWFRTHLQEKDILISTVGTIGRTSFVKDTKLGIAQNVLGLRFGEIAKPEYMFYTIKNNRFQYDMDARLVTTVQASIKRKDLNTIKILVPNLNVQLKFCSLTNELLNSQDMKVSESNTLAKLRDTLLPKLISGELRLPPEAQG